MGLSPPALGIFLGSANWMASRRFAFFRDIVLERWRCGNRPLCMWALVHDKLSADQEEFNNFPDFANDLQHDVSFLYGMSILTDGGVETKRRDFFQSSGL